MNDLPLYIDSPHDMYADDSTIHVTGIKIEELESKLNIDLKNVQIWCQKNPEWLSMLKKLKSCYSPHTIGKLNYKDLKLN